MDLSLSADEHNLFARILDLFKRASDLYKKAKREEAWKLDQEAIPLAVELHAMLKSRGFEPVFKSSLIEARGAPVGSEEFYRHHHSLEALISFVEMPGLAGDLPDLTINHEFKLEIWSRRSGYPIQFTLTRIATGWTVALASSMDCGPDCAPFLFDELKNELIQYPHNLGDRLEFLWERAKAGKSPREIQRAFDDLGKWLSDNERRTPTDGAWQGYT